MKISIGSLRKLAYCTVTSALLVPVAGQAAEPGRAMATELSVAGMFLQADWVVKSVMIGLAIAVLATWVVLAAKKIEIGAAARVLREFQASLLGAPGIADAMTKKEWHERVPAALLESASDEIARARGDRNVSAIKERIAIRLSRVEVAAGREISMGMSVLATIGATAPFVGLFGTVWGIMNSFIGISKAQTTNLAVVAPGIAEALLATAIGLVAAIPAVVIYNHLGRSVNGYRALVADASALVLVLAGRDLDRIPEAADRAPARSMRG